MKEKAQAIFNHFEREAQLKKAKEEHLELTIALSELSKFDLKGFLEEKPGITREELIYKCNEELADNIVMYMQFEQVDFKKAYNQYSLTHSKGNIYLFYFLENFEFDKDLVYKIANQKIERTIKKFNISLPVSAGKEFKNEK